MSPACRTAIERNSRRGLSRSRPAAKARTRRRIHRRAAVEADLLIALKAWGGVRQAARAITTATGAALPWPTMDDTGVAATILATENTTVGSGTDLAFGRSSLGAYTYVSGVMPVSLELLQDTVFDVDGRIRNALARQFGVGQNPISPRAPASASRPAWSMRQRRVLSQPPGTLPRFRVWIRCWT